MREGAAVGDLRGVRRGNGALTRAPDCGGDEIANLRVAGAPAEKTTSYPGVSAAE